jgi:hypothetical protein
MRKIIINLVLLCNHNRETGGFMLKINSAFCFLLFLPLVSFTQSWKQIGIINPSDIYGPQADLYPYGIGVVWDVKFEPQYNRKKFTRLYATGVSSGLWLSPGGKGNDWILLNTDFLPETSIGDFAINPKNRNKIIVGTGLPKMRESRNKDLFGLPRGRGIFKGNISKKNKVNWHRIPDQVFHDGEISKSDSVFWNEKTKCVGRLCYSADASAIILVVIEEETKTRYNSYIYKSVNDGGDWYLKASYKNLFFQDLDINPTNPKDMVATFSNDSKAGGHIFESNDMGETWNAIFTSSPELNEEGFYKTCFDNEIPARLWICKTTVNNNAVFIRTNEVQLVLLGNFSQFHNAGGCSAFDISRLSNNYFSTGSLNLNCTFNNKSQSITYEMHSDIRCIAYYPGSADMVVANDGGVSLVDFDGRSYKVEDISRGLEIGRVTKISSSSKDNYGFANWDNSCRWVNANEKRFKFMDLFGNEATVFAINDSAFLDGSAGPTSAALYTFDSTLHLKQHDYYSGNYFTFIPHKKKFLYVDGTQLHRVNYSGNRATDSIINTHPQGDKNFLQPRVSLGNSNIIYTGTQQQGAYYHFQVFKSVDGGDTWTQYNTQAYGGSLSDIAINPDDPDKICVGSIQGEVFFSTNSGLSFSNNTMPVNAGAINTLTYIDSGRVLAACDYGLWICRTNENGEKEWMLFNDLLRRKATKLPNCRISDVEYLPREKIIRAATMGRGVFECEIKNLF